MSDNTSQNGSQTEQTGGTSSQTTSQQIQEFTFIDTAVQVSISKSGDSEPLSTKDMKK